MLQATPTYLSLDLSLTNNLVESIKRNPDSLVYLYTTKDINVPNNVTLVNMSNSNSWNAGIENFNGTYSLTAIICFKLKFTITAQPKIFLLHFMLMGHILVVNSAL